MDLNRIYSPERPGSVSGPGDVRSSYQRDFDRLIFSSAFRRLQNKTQVFPLPGSAFVHNRLTHSLEVASVGRSLGTLAGDKIVKHFQAHLDSGSAHFYRHNLAEVIAAGCLAHDIGNPAYGHSGESAISSFFTKHEGSLKPLFHSEAEWQDLANFEGNANSFRILTHQFQGRLEGGFMLTWTTLASILKYPCESTAVDKSFVHRKKYGFFQADKAPFETLAEKLQMPRQSSSPDCFARHPFAFLLEAADDICYLIVDFEDAHRLKIVPHDELHTLFVGLLKDLTGQEASRTEAKAMTIGDINERVAYLRSKAIFALTNRASEVFDKHLGEILAGSFNHSLLSRIEASCSSIPELKKVSHEKIYNHKSVVELELAGYKVMDSLLEMLVFPALKPEAQRTHRDKKALHLVPPQFGIFTDDLPAYQKTLSVLDFVSGMTDVYATEIYRKLHGIEIGRHN